ncbi:MAG TPA: ABC transporter substrate-binding protein [Stellaceae bacterium]|nr:ABC transporter substrate-binding protein [Stellaceae bacterium]
MCDRHGRWVAPDFRGVDFSRRRFIERAAGATLAVAVPVGFTRAADPPIKATHGAGFCNLNFFYAHALHLAAEEGLDLELVETPGFSDQVAFLGEGQVDLGVLPYTSYMALYDQGAPVKIVGGGGIQGCLLLAGPGLDTPAKLKGRTLGTFQLDTLEVLPYDWLKTHGVNFKDITVRYMGSMPEAVEAFKAGAIDMFGAIEPYGTTLLNEVPGSIKLTDGTDIYGPGYTDCVFAARTEVIDKNPHAVKGMLRAMMRAQAMAEKDPEAALNKLVGPYYKTSIENARMAMSSQPSVVDNRNQERFILERSRSLVEMGYIKRQPAPDAMVWTLLEAVIAENPALYSSLKYKSA